MSRLRATRAVTVVVVVAVVAACSSGSSTSAVHPSWTLLPSDVLAPAGLSVNAGALLPGDQGAPWLLGGNVRAGGAPSVRVWDSPDTLGWSAAAMQGLTLDAPQNLVFGLARRGRVSVAIGETPGAAHGNPRPTIWRSTDGLAWSEVPTLREDFGGPRLTDIRAVTAGPLGFAIVGNWKGDGDRPVIAVWLSTDGLHWEREDHVPELTSQGDEELTVMDIAAGPGGLVIAGESYAPTADHPDHVVGVLATSSDGRSWRRVDLRQAGLDSGDQVAIRRVTARAGGFVAVGTRSRRSRTEVAAWSSSGGRWTIRSLGRTPLVQGADLTVDGRRCWIGIAAGGRLFVWLLPSSGAPRPVEPPGVESAVSVLVGSGRSTLLVGAQSGSRSLLWTAVEPPDIGAG